MSQRFWKDVTNFICAKICDNYKMYYKHVVLGYFDQKHMTSEKMFIVNLIILLAKYFIHKCKFGNKEPIFYVFRKEIDIYFENIEPCINGKAVKTLKIWSQL